MTGASSCSRWRHLTGCALLLWGGVTIGVAFIATPAKFLATTLTWTQWLDVGRHTIAVYNRVELIAAAVLVVIALLTVKRMILPVLVLPSAIVLAETFWLIPALDGPVIAFIYGARPLPSSPLHFVFICAELLKTASLVLGGSWLLRCASGEPPSPIRLNDVDADPFGLPG
jgi:hypothetical protein